MCMRNYARACARIHKASGGDAAPKRTRARRRPLQGRDLPKTKHNMGSATEGDDDARRPASIELHAICALAHADSDRVRRVVCFHTASTAPCAHNH